jgi:hypothetical protein
VCLLPAMLLMPMRLTTMLLPLLPPLLLLLMLLLCCCLQLLWCVGGVVSGAGLACHV